MGGSGLAFEALDLASTGYVFARDAWGRGYAAETLRAVVDLARSLGVVRLSAVCHPDHRASARVLEKCGFARETSVGQSFEFPNLAAGERLEVLVYALALAPTRSAAD